MAINKVDFCGQTLIDLSQDTVTPEALQQGVTAHDKTGKVIQGTKSKEVVFVEYGVTTFDEVLSIYNSGAHIVCLDKTNYTPGIVRADMQYVSVKGADVMGFRFAATTVPSKTINAYGYAISKSGGWSFRDVTLRDEVPESTEADAGKFLRVNTAGSAEWQTVPNANGVSFGG